MIEPHLHCVLQPSKHFIEWGPSQNTLIVGGRYDNLSTILGGRQIVPASGWAAGINRIIEVITIPEFGIQNKIDIVLALVIVVKI